MIEAFALLLLCQLAGEILVRALALPLPGPVAGMILLFGLFFWRGNNGKPAIPHEVGNAADGLLRHLAILFVPASVGITQHIGLLRQYAGGIALTIIVSTLAALAVTALVFHATLRFLARRNGAEIKDRS
jgi:putative effector of murein hydrolase LrgA (UPF0299 family)